MNFSGWLLIWTLAFAWYGVGIVWLVQIVAWPLFSYVGRNEFDSYHLAWWRGIRYVILAPAGLAFLGGILLLRFTPSGIPIWIIWAGVGMEIAMWGLTALWFGPRQAKLTNTETGGFRLLIKTHWLRTALISGYGLVLLAALVAHIGAG